MADTLKTMGAGTFTTTEATLYTVPASTKGIVSAIQLCNLSSSDLYVDLKFDGVPVVYHHDIPGYNALVIKPGAVLEAGKTIKGTGEADSALTYHVSGIEVT